MSTNYSSSGILFRSERKARDGPRSRGMNGSGELTCPHCGRAFEIWLSAWKKTANNGNPYMSLAFKPKDATPNDRRSAPELGQSADDDVRL